LDEKQRKALEVTASGGLFKDHSGALLDTSKMETSDAGAGWAAFVVSGNYKLYVHSHLSGRFHHSSFLAGGRVLAAGEISIIQGNLVAISRKSGHYQPDDHMLFFFLSWLSRRNVNLNHIPVRLSVQEPIMYYDACQIMYNGGNSKGLIPIEGPITNI
jgi:hypothetical protein